MGLNSVEIREAVKYHGTVLAVDHLSLEVRRGEFFSILGPSGSGKTTTLRLLAGFERPDQGEILIEGRSMREVPPNLRPVNLVFQSYALFPHLTVFGNIAFGLEMRRIARAEIQSRVHAALGMVKLMRHVIGHLAITGGMAASDSLVQQMLGHGIAAKLSQRLGEGVLNGLLTARLGLAAIDVTRPLPFTALPRPALTDLAKDLLRKRDGEE